MKENMLDILMYLLENYICGDIDDGADEASLRVELQRAGFPNQEINKAFSWLDGLASMRDTAATLTAVPHPASREMVIDRVMALDTEETDLADLKWVILLILFNQPGKEAAFAWMEDLLFEGNAGWLH